MKLLVAVATVLVMSVLMPAATAPAGAPAAVRYIGDDKVSAAMAKGGPVLQDPGLAIVAVRSAPSAAAIDPTIHHIFLIQEGEATLVTGGTLAGKTIEGGQNHRLKTGDMIVIPARTPYWWKEVPSGTVGYLAVNKQTPQSGNTWGLPDVVQLINANRIKTRMTEPGGPADPLLIDPGVVFYAQRKFKDDEPEIHPNHSHIFILMDGEATFLTGEIGAAIVNGKAVGATTLHQLKKGGIMVVPSKTPHQWISIRNNAFGPKEAIGYIAINMDDPR
jgi:mannose-6-phosphate isomerase-like protein (cupin superfamily)